MRKKPFHTFLWLLGFVTAETLRIIASVTLAAIIIIGSLVVMAMADKLFGENEFD